MGVVQTVPIIDVAPFLSGDPAGTEEVVRQVGRACEPIGFLVLTGRGETALSWRARYVSGLQPDGL